MKNAKTVGLVVVNFDETGIARARIYGSTRKEQREYLSKRFLEDVVFTTKTKTDIYGALVDMYEGSTDSLWLFLKLLQTKNYEIVWNTADIRKPFRK